MINLTKGNTETIYFTATERATLTSPFFLFVCISRGTGVIVKWVSINTSVETARYDKTSLVVNTYFSNKDNGLWTYEIYEQLSDINTDPTGLNRVEEGFLKLNPATEFAPTEYTGQNNTFKTYGE